MTAITILNVAVGAGLLYSIAKESKLLIVINSCMTLGIIVQNFAPKSIRMAGMLVFILASIVMFMYVLKSTPKKNSFKTITILNMLSFLIPIVMRIMHWPGSSVFMVLGILPIIPVVIWLIKGKLLKEEYLSPIIVSVPICMYHFFVVAENWM